LSEPRLLKPVEGRRLVVMVVAAWVQDDDPTQGCVLYVLCFLVFSYQNKQRDVHLCHLCTGR
jgi:hypothetical protein